MATLDRPFEGRTALITGAAGMIGRATAKVFAERGATLVLVDHPSADWSAARAVLPDADAATYLSADVTRDEDVKAYVEAAKAVTGRIDVFFNNAGIEGPVAPVEAYPADQFRKVLDVNVVGVFLGLQQVMPVMLAQRSGAIVNTSSIAGLVAAPQMAGYCASKHAVVGLTRVAALQGAPSGVRVNSIHPGYIDSRMLSDIATDAGMTQEALAETVPAGRLGSPEEIAKAVAFLASDEASYMNGAALVVDGAKTAG